MLRMNTIEVIATGDNELLEFKEKLRTSCIFVLLSGCMIFLWRLWRFTLLPYLKVSEPREYPYWIPGEITRAIPYQAIC